MFTGIVESIGKITSLEINGSNKTFWIESTISSQLRIDESICHNGVCLTIEEIQNNTHKVTAIKETLNKTNTYAFLWRIQTAKKPETRANRIAKFIDMLNNGQKFH